MQAPTIASTETADDGPDGDRGAGLARGDALGRYRIVRAVGSGGMGSVFEAVHEEIGRRVAIKVLHPSLAARPTSRERFFREARAAARVHHPGVVQVHHADIDGAVAYLVMDFLEGESLARRLERGPIAPAELLALLGPALDGVACAHEAGVVHRDLKPANLQLVPTADGARAVVVDFGVSRLVDEGSDLTGSASVLGTPAFMSPEQARGARDVGAASDQFSLGAVLYTCLAGRRPFAGLSPLELAFNIQRGDRPPLATLAPSAPTALVAAVERAMAPTPGGRFPSVRDLAEALRRSLDAPAAPRRPSRTRALVAAAVALLGAVVAWRSLPRGAAPPLPRAVPMAAAPVAPAPPPVEPPVVPPAAAPIAPAPVTATAIPAHPALRPRVARRAPVVTPVEPPVGRNRAVILGR